MSKRQKLPEKTLPLYSQNIELQGAIHKINNQGKQIWRTPRKGGADLEHPPLTVLLEKMEQSFLAEVSKIERTTNLLLMNLGRVGVKARKGKADIRKTKVLKLDIEGKPTYKIVNEVDIKKSRVNQIKKKEKG